MDIANELRERGVLDEEECFREAAQKSDDWHRRLLRTCPERPRPRAAEQRDELAPPHAHLPPGVAATDDEVKTPARLR
jgi:hypothetical protein